MGCCRGKVEKFDRFTIDFLEVPKQGDLLYSKPKGNKTEFHIVNVGDSNINFISKRRSGVKTFFSVRPGNSKFIKARYAYALYVGPSDLQAKLVLYRYIYK